MRLVIDPSKLPGAEEELRKSGKAIPGFPGYTITRDGKVHSDRQAGGGGGRKADDHEVTSTDHGHKYARVVLMKDGKKTTKYIHELLAMTYHGGTGEQVRHLDGKKEHNTASNVKPGTAKENGEDRVKHGTAVRKSLHIVVKE